MAERSKFAANEVVRDSCMDCGRPWDGATLPASYTKAWCGRCEAYTRFEARTYVPKEKYEALREVAATMASTLTDVVNIVDVNPEYPWRGGALKAQMREDVTAYEALGLDLP